jgi:hypothetical protein
LKVGVDHRGIVVLLKRRDPGQALVQHAAEGVNVYAAVNVAAHDLFRLEAR